MPFGNPIVAGTFLVRSAIRSPNYVVGVSGWTINQDGTAEFAGSSIRGILKSANYVLNTTGWALNPDGSADLNNVHVRGAVEIGSLSSAINGNLSATVNMSTGTIQATAPGAANVILDAAGLRGYDVNGLITLNLDATTGYISCTGNITVIDGSGNALATLDSLGNLTAQSAFITQDAFIQGLAIDGTATTSPNIPRIPGGGQNGVGGAIADSLPYGCVSFGPFLVSGGRAVAAGVTWGLVSNSFQAEAGRMYVVEYQHVKLIGTVTTGYSQVNLRMNLPTSDGDQSQVTPPVGGGAVFGGYRRHPVANANYSVAGTFGPFRCGNGAGFEIPHNGLVQLVLDINQVTSGITFEQPASIFPYQGQFNVYDVGPVIAATTGFLDVGAGSSVTPTQNHTKVYSCNDSGTFDGSNAFIASFGKEIIQGNNQGTGGSFGTMSGMAIFPDMTADLVGATITAMSFTIHNHHWWFNAGGTVDIGYHGNTTLPGTFNVGTWPKVTQSMSVGATNTFAIDSSNWASFKAGTFRGLSFHAPSSSATYYGRFDGNGWATPPKITVSYTK